jgi:hypothetical protein
LKTKEMQNGAGVTVFVLLLVTLQASVRGFSKNPQSTCYKSNHASVWTSCRHYYAMFTLVLIFPLSILLVRWMLDLFIFIAEYCTKCTHQTCLPILPLMDILVDAYMLLLMSLDPNCWVTG